MDRRHVLLGIASLALALPALAYTGRDCPLCAGALVDAGSVEDDITRPSLNLSLWSRSSHGDFWSLHSAASPFCTKCYHAWNDSMGCWERASERSASFRIPLQKEILGFPLSPMRLEGLRTVYTQQFAGADASDGRVESVRYWARDSRKLRAELQTYADAISMEIAFDSEKRGSRDVFVSARTPNRPFTPMSLLDPG